MKHVFPSIVVGFFCLGLMGLFTPASSNAHSVTFDFTGTVVAADRHSLGGIMTIPFAHRPASTIFGSVTFDADTLDTNGSATVGRYNGAIENLSVSVSNIVGAPYQFDFNSAGPLNAIRVNADPVAANQAYMVSASVQRVMPAGPIMDGVNYFGRDFFINLLKPTSSVFATDALPETAPRLTPFSLYNCVTNPQGQFRLVFSSNHGDHTLIGNLTSLTVSAVPIPAAVYLFGSGLIGLIGLARRKMSAVA